MYATALVSDVPAAVRVYVTGDTVLGSSARLKYARIVAPASTPVAPPTGRVESTASGPVPPGPVPPPQAARQRPSATPTELEVSSMTPPDHVVPPSHGGVLIPVKQCCNATEVAR